MYLARCLGVTMSYITIDDSKCKSCYLCVDVCPKKLLKPGKTVGKAGQYIVEFQNNNECIACKQCAMVCPDAAITGVYKE